MLVSLMRGLESIPESSGTMMDNTLIEHTINNAEKQRSEGADWPFVLLGDAGGRFKAGQHTPVKDRPINDLYTTLLRGAGSRADRFNVDKSLAKIRRSKLGPIEELLV